jgi:hypothetical protein
MSFLDLLEKFLKNYEEAKGLWIGINWCFAILFFVIGAIKGYDFVSVIKFVFIFGLTINVGMYLLIRACRQHLMALEGEEKERAHKLLFNFICKKTGLKINR